VDLGSKLRAIVRNTRDAAPASSAAPRGLRELTYEPDGGYEATIHPGRVGEILGGRSISTQFGECLVVNRRYESERRHGDVHVGDCELEGCDALKLLDPALTAQRTTRTVFIDLETTGLSGGAGTIAFLVGCGCFDLGAFEVRQFLLTSHAGERALLAAVAAFVGEADLIVTYNGKTFDIPVMETRWSFHRMAMPLDGVPHFDMLHPARRLWSSRTAASSYGDKGCRLTTLERALFEFRRAGDVPGLEIPSRFFRFLRTGDPRPLEPVLEHNRLDLVSLAAVTARAARLAQHGHEACRDTAEALALGRVFERAGEMRRAEECYRKASASGRLENRAEALYRLGLRLRREGRFSQAAESWHALLTLTGTAAARQNQTMRALRQFAVEALAIHNEHRAGDLATARELALFALEENEGDTRRADGIRHRLARLERKLDRKIARAAQVTLLPPPAASSLSPPASGSPTSGRRTAS
jgi:hypothetical protein